MVMITIIRYVAILKQYNANFGGAAIWGHLGLYEKEDHNI